MKINIFKIPKANVEDLKDKLRSLAMDNKHTKVDGDWICSFYLSTKPEISDISWVKDYELIVPDISKIKNVVHYAIYLCTKGEECFALTYGKSHFYIRKFCDDSFGLEMAKRVADENDIKQKATKRFSGREKKGIKSFVKNTRLDSESGESVDYISAGIVPDKRMDFGERSKFGSSMVISRDDLSVSEISSVLDSIVQTLSGPIHFELPKTSEVKDPALILGYVAQLLEQIKNDASGIETDDSSYDLVGVDFVFHTTEKYTFHSGHKKSAEFADLSQEELRNFIITNHISDNDILNIRVEIRNENDKSYLKPLYEMIEYMVPNENVVLENGKWKRFNEEYLDQINASIDSITIDTTEPEFNEISLTEPDFNNSPEVSTAGYEKADTDFSKIKIASGYNIEAWDLQKGDTSYAVKFGNAQKLVYVCSQAMATLDIIRNNANLKKLENPPERYCLWMGFERSSVPTKLSEVRSIILKQHVDMFARKCREIGIKPVLKFSKKTKSQ